MTSSSRASNFDQLWAEALSTFYATTDRRLNDKSLPLLTTLDDLKLELGKRQDTFAEFRKKRHALYDGMSRALAPIVTLTNIAAGGLSNAFPPSGVAFNAFSYMIMAAGNVSASYDSVCDLLEELSQFTTRLTVHAREEITPELRGIVIEILCAMIRLCGYAGRLMEHGRINEYFRKVYLGKDKEIANEIATIRHLTETEARMVGALTLSATTRTERQVNGAVKILADVSSTVQETNLGINELRDQVSSLVVKMNEMKTDDRTDVEKKQLDKIRLVLAPSVTPEEIYRGISGKRVPGTGDWVHQERLFKAWLEHEKPILWISGGPGAGKSYLSSNIIQLLTQLYPQGVQASSRISVAYYFCKDYDADLRSFNKALKTLAFQICQNDPVFAKYVAGICSFPEDIRTTESLWRKLFVDFFGSQDAQSMVYILIDGMDEAFEQERATFLELLKSLHESNSTGWKPRVQILMVGRPELSYDIEQVLEGNLPTISVSASKNAADIHHYVTTKVTKERNLRRISAALRNEIVTELTKRADGMFLWVDLMLKEIASKHKEIQMREALQRAPKGLFDTIQHTLDRMWQELSEEDAENFEILLMWVACAKRPFTLGELDDIIKISSKDGEGVVYLEGELRKRYASFFDVNREDGRTTEELQKERVVVLADEEEEALGFGDATVRVVNHDTGDLDEFGEDMDIDSHPLTTEVTFSHASFGDFFRTHRISGRQGTDFSTWSLQITKHLLRMLCVEEVREEWKEHSISKYASAYWQDHLRDIDYNSVTEDDRSEIGQHLCLIFHNEHTREFWTIAAINMQLFQEAWIFTDANTALLNKWLRDEDLVDPLGGVINLLATGWLQGFRLNKAENFFMTIKAYQDKTKAIESGGTLPKATDYEASDLAHNSAETILEVARRFGFEEDFTWNSRIGRVLREAGHYDTATTYIQRAVDVAGPNDIDAWRAYSGLSQLYGKQSKYSAAIEAAEKGLKALDKNLLMEESAKQAQRKYWWTQMLYWNTELNNKDSVLSFCKLILKSFPENYSVATTYITVLSEENQHDTAMEYLREASREMLPDKGYSRLTDWCIEMMWNEIGDGGGFYDGLVLTCRKSGDKHFAKTTYLDALKEVKKTDTEALFFLQADYGQFLLREMRKPKQAARILEKVLEDAKASRKDSASSYAKLMVIDILSEIYMERALQGGKDSKEASINMEKLNKIWTLMSKNDPATASVDLGADDMFRGDVFMTTRNTTLVLATLYRVFGQPEKARPLLKEHLKLGLDLLIDEDPENDWEGYIKMADALARAGDFTNALAAYTLITPKLIPEKAKAEKDDGTDANTDANDPDSPSSGADEVVLPVGAAPRFWYTCDGLCGTHPEFHAEDTYVCLYCLDKNFCRDCHALLLRDALEINICGGHHKFLFVPIAPPFKPGHVPVAGVEVEVKDWLAGVRREWGLS